MAEMTTGKLDRVCWVNGCEGQGGQEGQEGWRLGRLVFTDRAGVFRTIWLPEAEVRLLHKALEVMLDPPKGKRYKVRNASGQFWSMSDGWCDRGTVFHERDYQAYGKDSTYIPGTCTWVALDPVTGKPEDEAPAVPFPVEDDDEATRRGGVVIVSHTAAVGMERGAKMLKPRHKLPDPGPGAAAGTDPAFEAVWKCIKSWDINVPEAYVGYCGATGNHVQAILDALYAEQLWFLRDVSVVDGCLKVEFWNREPYTYALPLVQGTPPEDGGEYYRERAESFVRLVGGHREMERHDQPGMPRNIFIDDPDQSKAESVEQMQASVTALLEHECSKAAGQALYELLTKAQEFMHVPDYPGLPDVERAWWILSDRLREGPERRWEAARYHRKGGSPEAVVWALQWRWNLPDGVRPPPSAQGLKDGAWLVWTHQQEATIWSDDVFRDNFEPYVEPPTELRYYRARDVDTGLFWNAREGKWSTVGTLYSENDRRRLPDPRMFKEGNAPRWEVDAVGAVYNPSGGGGE